MTTGSSPQPTGSADFAGIDDLGRLPGPLVQAMRRVEDASSLDRLGSVVRALAAVVPGGEADRWLRGIPTGHALHPFLTDLPIGFWLSSVALDLRGRERDRAAADLLLELGLASTVPAIVTGLAEWRGLSARDARTGSLHATLNAVATTLYAGSLAARAGGRRRAGFWLSLAGTSVVSASGYLGGHLSIARKAGSRDPAFAPLQQR